MREFLEAMALVALIRDMFFWGSIFALGCLIGKLFL